MNLNSIPVSGHYIWVLTNDEGRCVIVDPGEAAPVLKAIAEHKWMPEAIFSDASPSRPCWRSQRAVATLPANDGLWTGGNARQGSNPSVGDGDTIRV